MSGGKLGWGGIVRLGCAQMALGSIAVIATSMLNRIMVVELALPAIVPGLLVGLHYALQVLRPRLGFASDRGGRTGWIVGGMAGMAAGVTLAACGAAVMRGSWWPGLGMAVAGYAAVGVGIGAMGTALLTLLAASVAPARRAAAATIVWVMMVAGSALTAGVLGHLLNPFSFARLIRLVGATGALATLVTLAAVVGVERGRAPAIAATQEKFGKAVGALWQDAASRRFTLFVFISMLAYGGQELVLEPFVGLVFGLSPGGSAGIAGLQHGGVMAGMVSVALAGTAIGGRLSSMRPWTIGGCIASAAALMALALAGATGAAPVVRPLVFGLGVANGVFAVAAIGAMMQLAGDPVRRTRAGTTMGLFGAAQAIAFGAGGLVSSGASDLARHALGSPALAYPLVFGLQAVFFLYAARLAAGVFGGAARDPRAIPALGGAT